jgi:hypothetical protein
MNDKTVIQMRADEQYMAGNKMLIFALAMEKAGRTTEMTADEAALFATVFDQGWRLATLSIQRNGNCEFERDYE